MTSIFLRNTWPLFLSIALLMLGNGLQNSLVGWRATYEGFSPSTTGWIMTGYYAGFLVGSLYTPKLLGGVGYIRVFAALASLASTAVLFQVIYINPINWFLMRLLTGFCFAGTYVIAESWLNASSSNETRGQTLSFYMAVSFGGLAAGQWLLKFAHPSGFILFALSSILLSLALVPILVKPTEVPNVSVEESLSIKRLFQIAPAGVFSIFFSAIAHGAMFAMSAVFAVQVGMTVSKTALFISAFIAFGALAQWPLGWLSDRFDRRRVILGAGLSAALIASILTQLSPDGIGFLVGFTLLGALSLPIYSISVAHTNDRLDPEQMTGASSTIILILGIGSILGPTLAGYLLNTFGPTGYLGHIGLAHAIIVVGMAYSILKRKAVAEEDQTQYQPVQPQATTIAMEAVAHEAEESQDDEDWVR